MGSIPGGRGNWFHMRNPCLILRKVEPIASPSVATPAWVSAADGPGRG